MFIDEWVRRRMRRARLGKLWKRLVERVGGAGHDGPLDRIEEAFWSSSGLTRPDYAHPQQRPRIYVPGLDARPWHDPADHEWSRGVEAAYDEVLAELKELIVGGHFRPQPQGLTETGNWDVYYLFHSGRKFDENCKRCPTTTALVESVPGATSAGLAYFSALSPGTRIKTHCGPTNTRLRCHFGLLVPPDCGIRVHKETRSWQEGKCLLLDDSFEHEAWNLGSEPRIQLSMDVWHPDLTPTEIFALTELARMLEADSAARRRAEPSAHATPG